jgi:hypothetical protein
MPLLRFVLAAITRSLRFVAPFTMYVTAVLILNTDPGTVIGTYGATLAVLFPVVVWLTYIAVNVEDRSQAAITEATAGSATRARITKVAAGGLLALPLLIIAIVTPMILRNYSGRLIISDVVAGVVGHTLAIVAGAAIGSTLMRPIVQRGGTAFLVATIVVLSELVLPFEPPIRQLLNMFEANEPHHLARRVTITAAQTVVLSGAILATTLHLARKRS